MVMQLANPDKGKLFSLTNKLQGKTKNNRKSKRWNGRPWIKIELKDL